MFCVEREVGLSHYWLEVPGGTSDLLAMLSDIMVLPFMMFLLSSIISGPVGLCYAGSTDLCRIHLWLFCLKK